MNDEGIEKTDLHRVTPLKGAVPYTTIRYRHIVDIPKESVLLLFWVRYVTIGLKSNLQPNRPF